MLTVRAADDRDSAPNADIRYALEAGPYADVFAVDALTGVLRTMQGLDRERVAAYVLTVVASDRRDDKALFARATVRLTVVDVNDNVPQFAEAGYSCTVQEEVTSAVVCARIVATDADEPLNSNSEVVYSIIGQPAGFAISAEGVLTATGLDREAVPGGAVELTVVARDRGMFPLANSTTVVVTITDINDVTPAFVPSLPATVNVLESVEVGAEILTARAQDADAGDNGVLVYSLDGGDDNGTFAIDPASGVLTLALGLDREQRQVYRLQVSARDKGVPVSLWTAVNVTVLVVDVNDNAPSLPAALQLSVAEDTPTGTPLTNVSATDADAGINGRVSFAITAGNEAGLFALSSISVGGAGSNAITLVLAGAGLDYEAARQHVLTITATDGAVAGSTLSAAVTVTVSVTDVNDVLPTAPQLPLDRLLLLEGGAAVRLMPTLVLADADGDGDPMLLGGATVAITSAVDDRAPHTGQNCTSRQAGHPAGGDIAPFARFAACGLAATNLLDGLQANGATRDALGAYELDGQRVLSTDAPPVLDAAAAANGFTVAVWVRVHPSLSGYIFARTSADGDTDRHYSLFSNAGSNRALFIYKAAGGEAGATSRIDMAFDLGATRLADKQWHFVALVISFPDARLIVDGAVLLPSSVTTYPQGVGGAPVTVSGGVMPAYVDVGSEGDGGILTVGGRGTLVPSNLMRGAVAMLALVSHAIDADGDTRCVAAFCGETLRVPSGTTGGSIDAVGSNSSALRTLVIPGPVRLSALQALLRHVVYINTFDEPALVDRTFTLTLADDPHPGVELSLPSVGIQPLLDLPPRLDLDTGDGVGETAFATAFTEGGAAVGVVSPAGVSLLNLNRGFDANFTRLTIECLGDAKARQLLAFMCPN